MGNISLLFEKRHQEGGGFPLGMTIFQTKTNLCVFSKIEYTNFGA